MSSVAYSFAGNVAVVTGAARGIGRAVTELLAASGARVALVDRDEAELLRVASELKGKNCTYACDVTNTEQAEKVLLQVEEEVGPVSMLVNSAGMSARMPAEKYELADFDRLMKLNVMALFSSMQIYASKWIAQRQPGVIVNLASIFGMIADPLSAPYAASKGAVIQLTKTCAVEWAEHGIRVNAVAPGYTYTAMTARTLESEEGKRILQQVPMKRAATVQEIANAVVFLASDAASFITGHTLVVDGGRTAV